MLAILRKGSSLIHDRHQVLQSFVSMNAVLNVSRFEEHSDLKYYNLRNIQVYCSLIFDTFSIFLNIPGIVVHSKKSDPPRTPAPPGEVFNKEYGRYTS